MASALIYRHGDFTELDHDPIHEAFMRDGCAVPELVERLKYVVFTYVSHHDAAPLGMTVYRGLGEPKWVIVLESPEQDNPQYAYVYADTLPDVMTLISEWTEVIHSMTACELSAIERKRLLKYADEDE